MVGGLSKGCITINICKQLHSRINQPIPVVHRVVQDLACGPVGVETLLVGDLDTRLAQPRDQR